MTWPSSASRLSPTAKAGAAAPVMVRSRSNERAGSAWEGAGDRIHRGRVGIRRRRELIQRRGPRPVVAVQPERPRISRSGPHLDRPEARQSRPKEIDLRPLDQRKQSRQELESVTAPDTNGPRISALVSRLTEPDALPPWLQDSPCRSTGLQLETDRARALGGSMPFPNRRGCCRVLRCRPAPGASADPSRPGAARIRAASSGAARSSPRGKPRPPPAWTSKTGGVDQESRLAITPHRLEVLVERPGIVDVGRTHRDVPLAIEGPSIDGQTPVAALVGPRSTRRTGSRARW